LLGRPRASQGALPPVLDRELSQEAREVVTRSLLRQLTEALCRRLLSPKVAAAASPTSNPAEWDGASTKIKIFLSHAKVEGAVPAKRVPSLSR
jgi:hypothetical protein